MNARIFNSNFIINAIILFIACNILVGQNQSLDYNKHPKFRIPTLDELEQQLDRAEYFLFKELIDSAKITVKPVVEELDHLGLKESDFALHARFVLVYSQALSDEKGEALESIYALIESCKLKEDWLLLAKTYLVAEHILERFGKDERVWYYLSLTEQIIEQYNLKEVYPLFCIRMYRYQRKHNDKARSLHYLQEAYESSKSLYLNQKEVFEKRRFKDFSLEFGTANTLMGFHYLRKNNIEKAEFYLSEATRVYQKVKNDFHMLWTYQHLARMHYKLGDIELAKIYSDNCLHLRPSVFVDYGFHGQFLKSKSLLLRADIFKELRLLDSALVSQEEGYLLDLKIKDEQIELKVASVEASYEDKFKVLKIEQQNEQLVKEKFLRRRLVLIILLMFLLIATIVYFYIQIRKSKVQFELQAEKLKELDSVKSNFFANISHELKTPLTLILGPLSYLLKKGRTWDEQIVKDQLVLMQQNGEHLYEMVEEILDLSKMKVGKLDLFEETTNLYDFFSELSITFEPKFKSDELIYSLDLSIPKDLYVLLDQNKVRKIVNNLLSNAIKFTPKSGLIKLVVFEDDSHLVVQVNDTGLGIPEDDLPHIFKRFFQSNKKHLRLKGGTGIGLALAYEYAKLMKGSIKVKSELNAGSEFTFKFPKVLAKKPNEKSVKAGEVIEEIGQIYEIGSDFNILVVEDNPDLRLFVYQLLASKYKTILLAASGKEGLEILSSKGEDIDLVISDVMMPDVDGFAMVEEIKKHPVWCRIPVVMLTALSGERDRMNALTIGVDDYLTKPFSIQELMVRVQNVLFNYHQRKILSKAAEINNVHVSDFKGLNINDKKWLDELKFIIEEFPIGEKLTIDKLAEQIYYSPRKLSRRLKPLTGLSPAKFIKEVRLQKARQILEDGLYESISEVAHKSGFDNLNTFSAVFKDRFGEPPSKYIKKSSSVK